MTTANQKQKSSMKIRKIIDYKVIVTVNKTYYYIHMEPGLNPLITIAFYKKGTILYEGDGLPDKLYNNSGWHDESTWEIIPWEYIKVTRAELTEKTKKAKKTFKVKVPIHDGKYIIYPRPRREGI